MITPLVSPPILIWAAFANPLMLWGLAAASLPIIIHLLNRRKFRETRWAAMRFLLAAIRKNQRRVRIEQWILLAVRTLLLVFLALALARPAFEQLANLGVFSGPRHWVLAVDGSLSMDTEDSGSSRFDQAKLIMQRLIRDARPGDGFSLITLADPPRTIIGAPAFAKEVALRDIEAVQVTHGGLDLVAALQAIDQTFEASDLRRKELVLLSDFQSASWDVASPRETERRQAVLARLIAKDPRGLAIDLGSTAASNRAVTQLSVRPAFVTPETPVALQAQIKAFGGSFPAGRARLVVDGRLIPGEEQQLPPLMPGESIDLEFRYLFGDAADHLVEVRIDDDPLLVDNRRAAVVSVRDSLQVLLVDGDPKPGLFASETAFLAEALSPETDSPGQPTPVRLRVISEALLPRLELADYEVVVLCNIARFSNEVVRTLGNFLEQGGGLVVFTGNQSQPDNYNRALTADGRALLPAQVGAAIGDPDNRENPFLFDTLGLAHPIVNDFLGQPDPVLASLTNVKTYRYHRLTVPRDSGTRVALALGTDPLIVEGRHGRGRVFLIATSADRDWTDWPIHQSYPPVMEKIVLEAASGRFTQRTLTVGQSLDEQFPAANVGAEARITTPGRLGSINEPDARFTTVALAADGPYSRLRTEPTVLSGGYRVQVGPPLNRQYRFAANPPPPESETAKLDQTALRAALPGLPFDYASDWKPLQQDANRPDTLADLHRPLLWAVIALILLESVLAWWFGRNAGRARA